ncbi:Putrescine ABC transporter putrescine-binding protein PotF [Geitlerinema sp. FC II]|nr:DUF3352 domain-containing protein [Geitlerinema sp. CS-897]PPT07072.1 Putrescine ABC transporter putrescine-binding protein PotF [Geitlerinema sp. FC II]
MMTVRKSSRWRLLGVAVLLVFGGSLAYWVLSRKPADETVMAGARSIPEDALMAVSVSTADDRWQRLARYGTPDSQTLFREGLAQLEQRLLGDSGYTYTEDIKPWVGDRITVAFLPPPPISPETDPEDLKADRAALFVLPIANLNRVRQLAEAGDPSSSWQERTYKGITVRERQDNGSSYAIAILDRRFLLAATDTSAIDRAIDAYKGNSSIVSTPGYNRAWETLDATDPNAANLFVNVPQALKAVSETSTRPVESEALERVETQGVAIAVNLENDGIRFKGLSWLAPNSETTFDPERNQPPTTVDRLPAETVLVVAGSNLKQLWQDYLQNARANALLPLDAAWLRSALQQTVGIDLEAEVLSWMTGEFALALVPATDTTDATFPGALVLMAQAGDRRAADLFFDKIDRAVAEEYDFEVEVGELSGLPLVQWDTRRKGLDVTHGWLNSTLAFFSVGVPTSDRLTPSDAQFLSETPLFERVVPQQPNPSNGLFFLNLADSQGEANLFLPRLPDNQQALLEAIDAIGVRAGILDERSSRYDIFIKIPSEQ